MFLTFFGLASIGLSCLMALFLYHVVFGVRYLGILNGVAAFVIIGIGKGKETLVIFLFKQTLFCLFLCSKSSLFCSYCLCCSHLFSPSVWERNSLWRDFSRGRPFTCIPHITLQERENPRKCNRAPLRNSSIFGKCEDYL